MTGSISIAMRIIKERSLPIGLILGIFTLIGILYLPLSSTLPIAGHRMLAILAFSIIIWISEAVSYEVSAIIITTLIAFLLGTSPTLENSNEIYGTSCAMTIALAGFSNSALALVAGALFIASAMNFTGLDKRIAIITLTKIGISTKRIMIGSIIVTIVLSLLVPSSTARSAAIVPIMMGVITALNINKNSNISAGIMIIVAHATGIWNIGIKTAAAQNLLTVGFMEKILGKTVTWSDWFIAGAPWSLMMSVILVMIVIKILPPEKNNSFLNKDIQNHSLENLGPITSSQKRLLFVSFLLLCLWFTEGKLHKFDTTSTTYLGLIFLILPKFGVMSWRDIQARVPWGTLMVFGVGISLGSALLSTQAAQWLGEQVILIIGLDQLESWKIFSILSAFLIIIHLGFASATALASSILPIMIAVLTAIPYDFDWTGLIMLLGFSTSYGFILPINAPQNMICMSTGTFNAKKFATIGILITVIGYLVMVLFSITYWKWLGWI
ncbi:MAG: DASS family sodium-coupled anion symporter [Bordetella sp.]|nr:MAG: DASS family sodium-coupled anion symporter [Bordetella sp.]